MATFKNIEIGLTAGEIMALVPVLDKEIAYQKAYAGTDNVARELESLRQKIYDRNGVIVMDEWGAQ